MKSFADGLSGTDKTLINKLRDIILKRDKAVTEKPGKIMRADDALCYTEDDVMKYGLARNKDGYTFHSMVMYANADVSAFVKDNISGIKLQKGCFNIAALEALDLSAFDKMMKLSAEKNFQPVIDHYKKTGKR